MAAKGGESTVRRDGRDGRCRNPVRDLCRSPYSEFRCPISVRTAVAVAGQFRWRLVPNNRSFSNTETPQGRGWTPDTPGNADHAEPVRSVFGVQLSRQTPLPLCIMYKALLLTGMGHHVKVYSML